jgi:hypothetical protein
LTVNGPGAGLSEEAQSDEAQSGEATRQHRPSRAARAAAFDFLCRSLSDRGDRSESPAPDWVALVEQANRERVVTNLYAAFERHGWPSSAPSDLREYLALVHEANAAQNRAIRRQAIETAEILNRAGISFAFLKGANWLLEVPEAQIGERWLADIDLTIAPRDWANGLAAIEAAGFRPVVDPAIYRRHFHHVPLARPGDAVTIELHRHLGWQRHLLTTDEVVAAAQRSGAAALSSPAHRFIYGSLHAQLQNMEYAAGHFSLRDLCDIQYLAATKGDSLDWQEIAGLARARGVFRYLAASLHLANRLLGVTIPQPFADSPRARRHTTRCLLQHRGHLRPRLTGIAVRLASLMDSRRLAYELDCEQTPWLLRQPLIAGGRLASVARRIFHGRVEAAPPPAN